MKKSLVALAILGTFTGAASAASSVTLYGNIEVNYYDLTGKKNFDLPAKTPSGPTDLTGIYEGKIAGLANRKLSMNPSTGSHFGIKGEEDLGNGLAATFKLEGWVDASDGQNTSASISRFFHRESTVGLKGAFGAVRLGRAKSQIEMAVGGASAGHGVSSVDLYSVAMARHSNGLFYDYSNNGFDFGADVTTKGGATANENDGTLEDGGKVAYGARFGYTGSGVIARLAYQNDGKVAALSKVGKAEYGKTQQEFVGALAYNFNELFKVPVVVGVSYAKGKGYARDYLEETKLGPAGATVNYADKATTLGAGVRAWFSPNDMIYVKYQKRKAKLLNGNEWSNAWASAVGYEHKFSKRTMVFADAAYIKANRIGFASYPTTGVDVDGAVIGYSLGLSHAF